MRQNVANVNNCGHGGNNMIISGLFIIFLNAAATYCAFKSKLRSRL